MGDGRHGWERPLATDAMRADGVRRLYNRLMSMPDVAGVFIHTLRDAPSADTQDTSSIELYYGLLHEDFSPNPAYCVFVGRSGSTYPGC